ncbi:MAG: GAF and ANTAR domain-containing protein [Nocardioidaceae bacterium]
MDDNRLLDAARRMADGLQPGDLDDTLKQITTAAVEVLPNVQYSSITVRHADGRLVTSAPTDDLLLRIDAAQYELQEGPCYDAATNSGHVISSNLGADERWPRYGPMAVQHGIRAQVGVRLFDARTSQGALNLYSTRVGAFDDIETLSGLFAHQAGVAIAYAQHVQNLEEAVRTRTIIGQAVGIVMERYQLDDERAFAFLARLSQQRNVKLRVVAEEIISDVAQGMAREEQ